MYIYIYIIQYSLVVVLLLALGFPTLTSRHDVQLIGQGVFQDVEKVCPGQDNLAAAFSRQGKEDAADAKQRVSMALPALFKRIVLHVDRATQTRRGFRSV